MSAPFYLDETKSYDERVAFVKKHNAELSDEQADAYFGALLHRRQRKDEFLQRGFSNRLAEKALDRMGLPRPWGWRTVFFYPDSSQLRWRYILILAAVVAFFFWRSNNG